jgi:hypothetical protein
MTSLTDSWTGGIEMDAPPPPTVESLGEYEEGIALAQETIYLLRKAGYDL